MRTSQRKKNKVSLRVDFEGEGADRVESVRKKRGLRNNSELVRALIVEEAQRQGIAPKTLNPKTEVAVAH